MKKIDKNKIKTWFVTGASSGIGRELCIQLLNKDYNVIAVARRIPNISHPNVLCLSADVTQPDSVNSAIKKGIERFGKIDVLSNNAGVSASITCEEETLEHMKEIMEVNFFGTFNTIHALLPHFRQNKNGTIINNSSMNGLCSRNYGSAYSSSKYAVEGLTGVIKQEAKRFVRCMVIEPGWIGGTELWAGKSILKESDFDEYKDLQDFYKHKVICENNLSKAMIAVISTVENENLPMRYMLGLDCQEKAVAKIYQLKKDLAYSKKLVRNYSFQLNNTNWIFSIKNEYKNNQKRKVVTVLGIKIKFNKKML